MGSGSSTDSSFSGAGSPGTAATDTNGSPPSGGSGGASVPRVYPSPTYYLHFAALADGRYQTALKGFLSEGRSARKVPTLWIDSICFHAMVGECYYHQGRSREALEHFTAALGLLEHYANVWQRLNLPPQIQPAGVGKYVETPWGTSERTLRLGRYPDSVLLDEGAIDHRHVLEAGGGVAAPAQKVIVNAFEVARCASLSLRRRHELLGPLGAYDPLNQALVVALERSPSQNALSGHWLRAVLDVLLGQAYAALGKDPQAQHVLSSAIVAPGDFDHPLTAAALAELGQIALRGGDARAAAEWFDEAALAAAQFRDDRLVEETQRQAVLCRWMVDRTADVEHLAAAVAWARRHDARVMAVSLLLLGAEDALQRRDAALAERLLEDATSLIGRREMRCGPLGARFDYVSAQAHYARGRLSAGDAALGAALDEARRYASWLLQLHLADEIYAAEYLGDRAAIALYDVLLRDPSAADWMLDPLAALAVLSTPHAESFDHWFEAAAERKQPPDLPLAFNIAEQARRRSFLSTLELGGRILAFQWLLAAPELSLTRTALLARAPLRQRYAACAEALEDFAQRRAALESLPAFSAGGDAAHRVRLALGELLAAEAGVAASLAQLVAAREPCELAFPPQRTADEIRAALPPGHVLLAFHATPRQVWAFQLEASGLDARPIGTPQAIHAEVAALLAALEGRGNRQLDGQSWVERRWREPAAQLHRTLLRSTTSDALAAADQLTIVPDGPLWYVPLEVLPSGDSESSPPLIERLPIRYAPTAALAVMPVPVRRPTSRSAVVLGNLYPREQASLAEETHRQLTALDSSTAAIAPRWLSPAHLAAGQFDRLVVLDETAIPRESAYDWSPLGPLTDRHDGTLAHWLRVPFAAPSELLLPGCQLTMPALPRARRADVAARRDAAARRDVAARRDAGGGRSAGSGAEGAAAMPPGMGDEVFLATCALAASGTRTVLLARWPNAGRTGTDLLRELTQELPHVPASAAWQRSVALVRSAEIDLADEPRVRPVGFTAPPTGRHPLLWAGYLLVDIGLDEHARHRVAAR